MPTDTKLHKGRKRVNLALQGGGAHGAFTWGVLDRLIRDKRIFIDGLSGTSAGALNATVFAHGFIKGGRKGACDALSDFWRAVSDQSTKAPGHEFMSWFRPEGADRWNVDQSPAFMMADAMTRMFSPYQLNPMDYNPLRDILSEQVDFAALRKRKEIKLFVA